MARPLKVLINAQKTPDDGGSGTDQSVMCLVHALGRVSDSDEQYIVITHPRSPNWLDAYLGPNQRVVVAPQPKEGLSARAKELLGPLRGPASDLWHGVRQSIFHGPDRYALPQSDGFYESLGGDIIHFPYQVFTRCRLPSVFNPWDLQHLHYPQFFSKRTIAARETIYRGACHYAQAVAAPSMAVKSDLQEHYGLEAEKIFVIYYGAPAALYGHVTSQILQQVRERFRLPDLFALFPAQTWPHKNHLRLLEAIRLVRDRNGVRLNLVCTGTKNEHWTAIRRQVDKFALQTQVFFLGYISPNELRALYRMAQFVVFPTLFEGAGFPVMEALQEGAPVICSDIPPLREYGGDAVLAFDPHSTEEIASSLLRISRGAELREQLRARGKERAQLFTWERTAKTYRALYRKVAGFPLSEEDHNLLGSDNLC